MAGGHVGWARVIYTVFRPLCHQLPERSFFLFGPRAVYSLEALSHAAGGLVPQRWVGNSAIGFKIAVCQRDVAIYAAMTLAGLAFYPLRRTLRPLPLRWFLALLLPMAIDGFGQLFGLWVSTWWSRVLTGGLFGLAAVWLTYPYLEKGMREVHIDAAAALHDLAPAQQEMHQHG
ncbi:MAG: DUF2085 domain-containing protein [Chloroflexi bacterium]|nr:DUF2085 domain-containing protein [Chloroflexota bacterium]